MPLQMTPTALAQGHKNALICGIPTVAVLCAVTAAGVLIFTQPFLLCIGVSGTAIFGLGLLAFVGKRLFGRNTDGRVLLDFGPIPTPKLGLMGALSFLVLGLMFGVGTIRVLIGGGDLTSESNWSPIVGLLILISFLPFHLIMARCRLQIREGGIWCLGNLLRWDKIGSYRWANDGTLLFRRKGFSSWFQGAIPIPLEHKQTVEELLAKHCPAEQNS